jgi:hypothetical protein
VAAAVAATPTVSPPPSQSVAPVQPLATAERRGGWAAAVPLTQAAPSSGQPSPPPPPAAQPAQAAATSSGQPLAAIPESAAQPPQPPQPATPAPRAPPPTPTASPRVRWAEVFQRRPKGSGFIFAPRSARARPAGSGHYPHVQEVDLGRLSGSRVLRARPAEG